MHRRLYHACTTTAIYDTIGRCSSCCCAVPLLCRMPGSSRLLHVTPYVFVEQPALAA
jgi:hypothetical protein